VKRTRLRLIMTAGLMARIVFWVARTPAAHAQQQDERGAVVIELSVTDSKGHYIHGLQPKDFRILEDGIVQKLNSFAETGNSYNATYYPAQNANEGFRRIEVQIVSDTDKKYRVRHKVGYRPRSGSRA